MASPSRFAATFRKLVLAALIAAASLAAAAPAAWGDEPLATAPTGGTQPPESPTGGSVDPAPGTGSTGNPAQDGGSSSSTSTESSSSSTDTVATNPQPTEPTPSSATGGPAGTDQASGDNPTQDSGSGSGPASAPDTSQQSASTQEGAGSASSLDVVLSAGQGPSGPTTGLPGPVSPSAPAVADIFDTLTGGSSAVGLLFIQAPGCAPLCYGSAASVLAVRSLSQPQRSPLEETLARSTEREPALLPGGPGKGPGRFFNLFGGAGGSGAALILLSLVALLGANFMRALSWIQLRLPTAVWPPSAYVPPIESPG